MAGLLEEKESQSNRPTTQQCGTWHQRNIRDRLFPLEAIQQPAATSWGDRSDGFRAHPFEPSPVRLAAARAARRRGRRLGWLLGDTILDRIRVDFGLRFFYEVLDLECLSYGLWADEPQTIDGLRTAQRRYVDSLCAWVPDGVQRILDVGCGTGTTALRLTELGFTVEGLSPDPYLGEVFQRRTGLPFYLSRFERFAPSQPYDLILMSESAQYVMLDQLFRWVMRITPGAYLLISDYFTVNPAPGSFGKSGHPLEDFWDEAQLWAFEEIRREDITAATAPTLDLSQMFYDRYLAPTSALAHEALTRKHPHFMGLANLVAGNKLRRWQRDLASADGTSFRKAKRYLRVLFESPTDMAELAARRRGHESGARL